MRTSLIPAAFGLAVMLAANAQAMTVKHAQGETEISDSPATVLVFDVASLDTLDTLGVRVSGVPGGPLPPYLEHLRTEKVPVIGTLFEPDYEAVAAAAPDLIIVGGRSAAKYADLAKIAPTIDLTVDRENFVAGTRLNVEILAGIFGKQQEAQNRLAALDDKIAALQVKSASAGKVLTMLTTGNRMSSHGPGSRFGIMYNEFGFTPAVTGGGTGNHGQAISNEFILETNPDWIFVVDRDAAIGQPGAATKALDNELVRQTKASQNGRVVVLDPVNWYLVGGGLTALTANVDQISEALAK